MPLSLYILAFSAFSIGMAEFIVVGILPIIAKGMHIPISEAGELVTFYAIGVAFSAPILTAATSNINRKILSLSLMIVFILSNITACLSNNFYTLLVSTRKSHRWSNFGSFSGCSGLPMRLIWLTDGFLSWRADSERSEGVTA